MPASGSSMILAKMSWILTFSLIKQDASVSASIKSFYCLLRTIWIDTAFDLGFMAFGVNVLSRKS